MKPANRNDFLATVPLLSRNIVKLAFSGKASAYQAIKAMCLTCTHYDRDEIENCTVETCPLHAYRPYRTDAQKARESLATRDLTVPGDKTRHVSTPDGRDPKTGHWLPKKQRSTPNGDRTTVEEPPHQATPLPPGGL